MSISGRIDKLGELPEDWDSYGAPPADPKAMSMAKALAKRWMLPDRISVVPCSDGSVQLEWPEGDCYVEVSIDPNRVAPVPRQEVA